MADRFYRTKIRVYKATLHDMADRFTGTGAPEQLQLSQEVKDALRKEAIDHARSVARTHNRAVRKEGLAISSPGDGRERSEITGELERFGRSRLRRRAEPIAVTESYGPHADAILSFFRDAGVQPEFSFGGHPDDAEPVCAICKAIIASNPHSFDDVLAIGVPHPNCRQSWHPLISRAELPAAVDMGRSLGGIVGEPMLIVREGGEQEAADSVVQGRG